MTTTTQESPTALSTRRIVVAGVLGAIAIVLGVTRLGFIPVPNVSGNATIMHIPAIIGAVLEGPIVGILAGAIFGIFSMLQDTTGLFSNPLVSVVPRLFIGLTAWLAYRSLARVNVDLAAAVAGVVGTLTNSILVVGMLLAFGLIPAAAVPTIIPQAIAEVVIAAVLTPLVVRGVNLVRSGRTSAEETTPRDKSSY
ncbi:MAG TPA: ECF transporter S component [Roseiflexaceae bacterium]|nr:ECF transporter S component [Roseiflexaceae bacterium]